MIKFISCLTFAGVLPFLAAFILLLVGENEIPFLGKTDAVISAYALVIVSFMAGSHWGLHFNLSNTYRIYVPVLSNVFALLGWFAFLILPFAFFMIKCASLFCILLLIDTILLKEKVISRRYFQTRVLVTVLVVPLLSLMALLRY